MKKILDYTVSIRTPELEISEAIRVGDFDAYELRLKFFDVKEIPGQVRLRFQRQDGLVLVTEPVTVENNVVVHTLTTSELLAGGPILAWVQMSDSNLYTPLQITFSGIVDIPHDEGIADTTVYPELLRVLDETTESAERALTAAQQADEAAASAMEIAGMTVAANTLTPGSPATATLTDGETAKLLTLGIPQGAKGDKGDTGAPGPQGIQGKQGIQGVPGEVTTAQLNAAIDLKVDKAQEAWITPTLENGWSNVSGFVTRYKKDALGVVWVELFVTGGTNGSTIFTLPSGYRPSQSLIITGNATGVTSIIPVLTNGVVMHSNGLVTSNHRYVFCFRTN